MLMIITLQFAAIFGVCGAAGVTVEGTVGGSVVLPSALGNVRLHEFFLLEWSFKDSAIVTRSNLTADADVRAPFRGRLELSSDFSVTVRDLTLQDSGVYRRTGIKGDGQIPTHTVYLRVYEPIRSVTIQPNITRVPENLTCEVSVMCSSSGDQSVSYTWRKGDQTVRSRQLHFSLSQQEGDVNITCTAANAVSEKNTTHTVRCDPTKSPGWNLILYIAGTGAAILLIFIIGLLVCCCRRKHAAVEPTQEEMTTYAVVNKSSMRDNSRSQSLNNPVSLYETVMEVNRHVANERTKPQTVYDKVALNRGTQNPPSPYNKVL